MKFLFQPNEEGAYDGRPSGAQAMIDEGALADPAPSAVFGLHVTSAQASGVIALRPGGLMASADSLKHQRPRPADPRLDRRGAASIRW